MGLSLNRLFTISSDVSPTDFGPLPPYLLTMRGIPSAVVMPVQPGWMWLPVRSRLILSKSS